MRHLSLALTGLSCPKCVKAVHGALSELISSDPALPAPTVDLATSSATMFVPQHVTDAKILEAVRSAGPNKSATIVSSQSPPPAAAPEARLSRSRYERRYRCGCSNTACCCSKVQILANDSGIIVTVVINDRLLTPSLQVLPLATSCGSCSCAEAEVCSCDYGVTKMSTVHETVNAGEEMKFHSGTQSHHDLGGKNANYNDASSSDGGDGAKDGNPTPLDVDGPASSSDAHLKEQITKKIIMISGMTCGSCAGIVTSILKPIVGIEKVSVNSLTSRAVLDVSSQVFDIQKAIDALEKSGYGATEVKDTKPNEATVYLRFSTHDVAKKACASLRDSDGVVNASILNSEDLHHFKSAKGKPNMVRCFRKGKASADKDKTDTLRSTEDQKSKTLSTGKRKRMSNDDPRIVQLESMDKLEAVRTLQSEKISYEVVPRSDPILSGSPDASALLDKEVATYFRLCLGAALFTLPLALLTMLFAKVEALGSNALTQYVGNSGFRIVDIIAWILATPVQFFFGSRFYRGSWYALKRARANMDVLIALGTSIAYAFSVIIPIVNTLRIQRGEEPIKEAIAFETAALLITIVLFGKWMESIAKKKTADGVEALASLAPRTAVVVSPPPKMMDLFESPVDVDFISPGDCVKVSPGTSFPVDGIVVYGETSVDESMLTGETIPVLKSAEAESEVYAGTINGRNPVVVRCTSGSASSMLEKVVALVKRAQECRAPIEAFADLVSAYFVPFVLVISVTTFLIWVSLAETQAIPQSWYESEGSVVFSLLFSLSVLVIACPCALGLATPTAVMVATSVGARKFGILYRDGGEALQAARNVGAVLFDKTGTLTLGKPTVSSAFHVTTERKDGEGKSQEPSTDKASAHEISQRILEIIKIAESFSHHPLAHAISQYCHDKWLGEEETVSFLKQESISGLGIRCQLASGGKVEVGNPDWVLSNNDLKLSTASLETLKQKETAGNTVVLAYISNESPVAFCIEDPIRVESKNVISFFRLKGIRCGLVTGDGRGAALNVSREVGIDERLVWSRALPADKMEVVSQVKAGEVEELRDVEGKGVVFVGDGINDAAALSAATVGIAMGSGSQIASENAGVVLAKSDLWDVVVAIDLAEYAFRRLKLNYVWALGFNTIGIPIAAGVLYPMLESRLPPFAAAIAMALSSLFVVVSSLTLNLYKAPDMCPSQ